MEQVALVGLPALAFFLLAGGAFATRSRGTATPSYMRAPGGRIVGQQRTQIEDVNVHFRRRKNQIPEAAPGRVDPFEAEPPPCAGEELPPEHSPDTAVAAPGAPLLTPMTPPVVSIPLRTQASGVDSRADRLVRQVRNEVEGLRKTLDEIATGRDDLLELDLDALIADPERALTLPPAVLVRAVVEAREENRRLQKRVTRQRDRTANLACKLHDLEREEAAHRARLETVEEVIAALHANLEDLRYERDHVRQGAVSTPQALRPGAGQLPQAGSGRE